MTIAEAMNFYAEDEEKYNLSKNTEFLTFLKKSEDDGYKCYISNDELQEMIDFLTIWFELKYPERQIREEDGIHSINYKDIDSLTEYMTTLQLLYRLPHNQECLLKCNYRSYGGSCIPIYDENGNIVDYENRTCITVKRLDYDKDNIFFTKGILPHVFIRLNPNDGKVDIDYELESLIIDKGEKAPIFIDFKKPTIKIKTLLEYLKNKKDNVLDTTDIEDCIFQHEKDLEIRNRILQLTALKILYSKKATPENGYRRSKRFIEDLNRDLGINLNTDEIDEIIARDYKQKKASKDKKKKLIKTIWHNNKF